MHFYRFVGELEFSDIPVDRDSSVRAVLGYLFLLAFVFLIVVVLMNLLNGLAVSDTAAIERVTNFTLCLSLDVDWRIFMNNYRRGLHCTLLMALKNDLLKNGASLFFSIYYTIAPIPIRNTQTPIVILRPTNPSSKAPRTLMVL